ncbi:hypothetical protein [Pseudomonas aeruginosa]|uniref:hypothetical protein n=1 Tax=Pseudomonas aeruginosa TaxID=287 RepID=UPI001CD3C510|nr:hypothetical protein [Pseudomonas aeruginosa]
MREEFEAWHHAEFGYVIAVEDDPQQDGQCAKRWKAWQASRAALRVELPFPIIVDEGAEFALHAYDKDETDKALQQAGIEVKP